MQLFAVAPVRAVVGLVLAVGGSAGSAGSWSVQATPNPAGAASSYLNAVACPSATVCTAVGNSITSSRTYATLAERWDGQRWAIQPTPNPPAAVTGTELSAVACPSVTDCIAVGHYWDGSAPRAFAEHWDGTAWAIQPIPAPPGATSTFLTGVACPSRAMCLAAGNSQSSAGDFLPLAERWNGTAWAAEPMPHPAGSRYSLPAAIACASANACTVVGAYFTSSFVMVTLAERWNGTAWAIQPVPIPPGATYAELNGVACPSAKTCTAVGDSFGPLAERWNGSTWAIEPTPGQGGLHSVVCPSPRICIAVGGPLAERWDGNSWAIQPVPSPAGSTYSQIDSVACASATLCTAAGGATFTAGFSGTLAERYS